MPDGGLFFWQVEIAEELLDGVDVYRTVHGIARAFLFAGMEADAARDAGEWVCLTEFLGGFFKLALLYEGIVAANVGPRRHAAMQGETLLWSVSRRNTSRLHDLKQVPHPMHLS